MKDKLSKNKKSDTNIEVLREKVVETNAFDLERGKIPTQSTIKAQIKSAEELFKKGVASTQRIEFDRLKIAVNLIKCGKGINFRDLWLEDVDEPWKSPSYFQKKNDVVIDNSIFGDNEEDEDSEPIDFDTFFDSEEFELQAEKVSERVKLEEAEKPDLYTDTKIKRRISFEDYHKNCVGLNNLYINNGYFIIDITGKWMSDTGYLGSLQKDNIETAIRKILDIGVVSFDLKPFLEVAQVFLCDVCVDLQLSNTIQCKRAIDGLSSFFPLASRRFNIAKYGRHGLLLTPKAKNKGYSLCSYYKGAELSHSRKRRTKAEQYTLIIGAEGQVIADRTLRFEVKLQKLETIRKVLRIDKTENRVVLLTDVLNSTAPVMLEQFKLFCGTSEVLLDRLKWLQEVRENENNLSFSEILVSERIVELFKENDFDLTLVRSHIRTEYPNVKDSEIDKACALSNLRRNLLNFLVYHKPKSVTIMLDILRRLYLYYSAESTTGGVND